MYHESVGIVQKIEFPMRPDLGCNLQNVKKSGSGQSVCVDFPYLVGTCVGSDAALWGHEDLMGTWSMSP